MFKIEKIDKICRLSSDSGAFAEIIPELGAMVHQIGLCDSQGKVLNILRCDSEEELQENPLFRGRLLFPFNDRIPDGKYTFEGTTYQLPPNWPEDASAIHGLFYKRTFDEVKSEVSETEAKAVFKSATAAGELDSYPFAVSLTVAYTLNSEGFFVDFTISNNDSRTVPVALGWHPYFTLGQEAAAWKMTCPAEEYVPVDETMMPTGEIAPVAGTNLDFRSGKLIGNDEIDIALTIPPEGITTLESGDNRLELYFSPELFSYVQLFVPPAGDSIAIEPITAATNAFNTKNMGYRTLEGNTSIEGKVGIKLT